MCSVESGLKHRGHLSSEANLYFISSFLVGIILCITLKENCLSLLSFEDLYISTRQLLQSESSGKYFLQDLIAEGSVSSIFTPLRLFKAVKNMLGAGKKLHWSGDEL